MKNGNESAFAYGFANEQSHQEVPGLSKREYFAAMAMQGLLSNSHVIQIHQKSAIDWIAEHSILQADALLDQLEKEEK